MTRRRARTPLVAGLAALMVLPAVGLMAATAPADPLASFAALDAGDLSRHRGGLSVGNLRLDFAIRLETTLQAAGEIIGLRTIVRLNDQADGIRSARTVVAHGGDTPGSGLTTTDLPGGVSVNLGGNEAQILHQLGEHGIDAVIANTIDGATIASNLAIDITAPRFSGITQTFLSRSRIANIGRDVTLRSLVRP